MDIEYWSVILAIFAGTLPVLIGILKFLRRGNIVVNCWFCNCNSRVRSSDWNSWTCVHCDQYNGFLPDGGYNRDLPQQRDESLNISGICQSRNTVSSIPSHNGLCLDCNRNQEMKVVQLASFQPIDPEMYDVEIETYRHHLERAYRLCVSCEQILEATLSRKKTLVLDTFLKVTGEKSSLGKKPTALEGMNTHFIVRIGSLILRCITLLLLASTTFSLGSSLIPVASKIQDHEPSVMPTQDNIVSLLKSTVCSKISLKALLNKPTEHLLSPENRNESSFTPASSSKHLSLDVIIGVLNMIEEHEIFLSGVGTVVQLGLTWYSRHNLSLFLWLLETGMVFSELHLPARRLHSVTLQGLILLLILILSLMGINHQKVRSPTPLKRISRRHQSSQINQQENQPVKEPKTGNSKICNGNQVYWGQSPTRPLIKLDKLLSEEPFGRSSSMQGPCISIPLSVPTTSPVSSLPSQMSHDSIPALLPVVGCEPSPASSTSTPVPSRPASILNESHLSLSGLYESAPSQDDARSDVASTDSAISNPDSSVLDGTESCFSLSKDKSMDFDVHSLIEGLNIGGSLRKQSKRGHEFAKRQYGTRSKRKPVLSPPKLVKTLNESSWGAGGYWQAHHDNGGGVVGEAASSRSPLGADQDGPPTSASDTGNSEDIEKISVLSRSPYQNSLPPVWNRTPFEQGPFTVCVPSMLNNHLFHPAGTAFGSPQISQVMYTPYTFPQHHLSPLWNPGVFVMPAQVPPSGVSGSPNTLHSSQLSNSFNSTFTPRKCRDVLGDDSDHDIDVSSVSSKRSYKLRKTMSSSFMESVWHSRFAIMYTTICYTLVGLAAWAFWHSGLILDMLTSLSIRN